MKFCTCLMWTMELYLVACSCPFTSHNIHYYFHECTTSRVGTFTHAVSNSLKTERYCWHLDDNIFICPWRNFFVSLSLLLRVQLTLSQYWSRLWFGTNRCRAITSANDTLNLSSQSEVIFVKWPFNCLFPNQRRAITHANNYLTISEIGSPGTYQNSISTNVQKILNMISVRHNSRPIVSDGLLWLTDK